MLFSQPTVEYGNKNGGWSVTDLVDNMNREIFEAVDLAMDLTRPENHRNLLDTLIVARKPGAR